MKKILTACGGVATCNAIAGRVRRLLKERNIEAIVETSGFAQVPKIIKHYDIYLCIIPFKQEDYPCPVLNGLPFLTGVGLDSELEKLIKLLEE